VPLSALANALSIASVSANEMCRKLQEQELVIYQPYKGVTLTKEGERRGMAVLRRRGLWTVFLTQKLGIEPKRAHEVAMTWEIHAKRRCGPPRHFPGKPPGDALGTPIPSAQHGLAIPRSAPLPSRPGVGHVAELHNDAAIHDFLHQHGLQVGTPVTVLSIADSGERLLAMGTDGGPTHHLSVTEATADQVLVVPQEDMLEVTDMICDASAGAAPHVKLIPLSQLGKDEIGAIVRINSRGPLRQRLLDMGIVTGEEIRSSTKRH
jgi:DtxR family Mn-dependent transcriptional regulator